MLGLSALVPQTLYLADPLFVLGLLSMLCSTIAAALELRLRWSRSNWKASSSPMFSMNRPIAMLTRRKRS